MPELPEVETVCRTLAPLVEGTTITSVAVPDGRLRIPVDQQALQRRATGAKIERVWRRAKYVIVELDNGNALLIHLGMSGTLGVVAETEAPRKHDCVALTLDGNKSLRLRDPRRFGLFEITAVKTVLEHQCLAKLGPEPLSDDFGTDYLHKKTRGSRRPIKTALLDAVLVVGVGNIYASEALFVAGIDPRCQVSSLGKKRLCRLCEAIKKTLRRAIKAGGTTLRDFRNVRGESGYFALELQVYGRDGEKCRRCDKIIRKIVQAGRSTFFCPRCQ